MRIQRNSGQKAAVTIHSPICVFAGGALCIWRWRQASVVRHGGGGEWRGGGSDSTIWRDSKGKGHQTSRWLLWEERFAAFNCKCGASPSSQPLTVQPPTGGTTAPVRGLLRSQRPPSSCGAAACLDQTRSPLQCDGARYREPSPGPLPTPLTGRGPAGESGRERGTGMPRRSR